MDSLLETIAKTEEHQFCVEMMKRLDIQRRNEHCCDVILQVGSGDDQARLKAHRIVLCAASPFFYNAFNSDMKEKKEGVIRLEEMTKNVMEEVLEYLYTGHVDINDANACELMAAADYFLLPTLKDLSGNFIAQTLSFSSCIAAYCLAVRYRCEDLQKKARNFILGNFVAVAETEDFLNLSSAQVEEWISSDEIVVKREEDVFKVLLKWIARNGNRNQSVIFDLLRHIRFIYITRDFLFNVILSNPSIQDNKECLSLVLDAMKLASSGTDDCYFSQSPRNCMKTHEDVIVARGTRKSTLCYIPSENKWYKLAKMLSWRRKYSQSTSSCHRKMYCIGGNEDGYPAECYDPSTNTWTAMKSLNEKVNFAAVVTFQGLLYVMGGKDKNEETISTVQTYSPDTNQWQKVTSLNTARAGICAVAGKNALYAVGGFNGSRLKIVERYDAAEKAWKRIASTFEGRASAGGAAINQKVFVFGGLKRSYATEANFCEVYDPAIEMWSRISSAVVSTSAWISAASFKGKIYVCGAFSGEDGSQDISLQEYDADCNEWKSCSSLSLGDEGFNICSLRIPKEVLDECDMV